MSSTASLAARVVAAVRKRPLLFNGLSGGVLCAMSDGITQRYESSWKHHYHEDDTEGSKASTSPSSSKPSSAFLAPSPSSDLTTQSVSAAQDDNMFDWTRFLAAGVIGVFFGGCVYPFAYAKLDAIWVGTAVTTVMKKSIVEIATVGIFVNSCSMTSRGLCREDKEALAVAKHVAHELPTVTKNDFLVWFPYNCMAFSVIPQFIRPVSTLLMEAGWQGYISFRSHDFEET